MTALLWFVAAFPLALIVHEAGHFAAAAALSLRVGFLSIGVGRVLARFRLGRTETELHALPLYGHIVLAGHEGAGRLRQVIFILGGVAANAALIIIIATVDAAAGPAVPQPVREGFALLVLVQLYSIVVNLVPYRYDPDGAIIGSDGMQLMRLLRGLPLSDPGPAYADTLRIYGGGAPSAAAPVIMRHFGRPDVWGAPVVRREALDALQRVLEMPDATAAERLLVLDFLVTIGLVTGDPEFRRRFNTWEKNLEMLDPGIAALKASLGALLVELGDFAAGKALLESAAQAPATAADPPIIQLFLARAEAGLGDPSAAHARFAQARSTIDESPGFDWLRPLAERVARELPAVPDAVA